MASAVAASAMMQCRVVSGVCSGSGRGDAASGGAAARAASRSAARVGASPSFGFRGLSRGAKALRAAGVKSAARSSGPSGPSTISANLVEPPTYQRSPEFVVASNGREVEQRALRACVNRYKSNLKVPKPEIPKEMLESAYERCRVVTGEYAKTFYLGTKLMTPEKQKAIWAIYVWCRRTDELVDGPNASHITPEALDQWEARLEGIFEGRPADVIDAALCDTLARFPVDIQPFRDMVDGMRMDLVKPRYENFDELYEYCYRVAGTVGLMSMPIMGCDDDYEGDLDKVYQAALSLGLANQLTNILRDVGEDIQTRNRIYVPINELAEYGIEESEIVRGTLVKDGVVDERWKRFMQFQIARAREVFAEAEAGVNCLHKDARWPVWSALDVYRNILDAIEANDYDNFSKRAYVPKLQKFAMLPTSYMKAQTAQRL